jgi:uncharacterized protein (DUF1800 family)
MIMTERKMLRRPAALALAALVSLGPALGFAQEMAPGGKKKAAKTVTPKRLNDEQRALHLLDRITYGPRPGEVERARKMGWEKYLDEQLRPERVSDQVAEAKLAALPTLRMSNEEIAAQYPPAQVLRRELQARGLDFPNAAPPANRSQTPDQMPGQVTSQMTDDELRARRREIMQAMRELGYKPQAQVVQELQRAKILRAVYSERQLQEVMTDFWFNHFNVFANKGANRLLITSYERDAIRPHVFGRFEDLLRATAKSPAMLFYLDNWLSASPEVRRAPRRARQMPAEGVAPASRLPQQRRRGINENYAREIMELHTLGVDGGYTQQDVTEVARAFTGWTIRDPRRGAEFYFNRNFHDRGEKIVLGTKIPAGGGIEDGEQVIKLLAHHPSTARFISAKLARRFVADDPPAALVARMSQVFLKTGGDLREVLRSLFTSPEFWAPEHYRAKIKTPFEMTVSAVRALGAETDGRPAFHRWIAQMGEPLYLAQPPTGYSDRSESWVNTGALLERMNFALALAGNRIPGTRVDLSRLAPGLEAQDPARLAEHYYRLLLHGQVTPQTRQTIAQKLRDPDPSAAQTEVTKVVGLVLGAPEFQRQ